jgi:hypothetical protein
MDKTICKICSQEFENDAVFHKHLRSHKKTQCEYFQTFYPKYDLFDKSIIKFKNKDYYFNTSFNSRGNLKRWLSSTPSEVGQKYVRDYLTIRKEKKGLVYAPSQVELRSLVCPGISWIEKNLGDYNQFCEGLGLLSKFKKFTKFQNQIQLDKRRIIYIDSREKQLVEFDTVKTVIKKLDYGDYCFSDQDWSGKIFIERKSANDFVGTLSGGFDRFEREIIRAKEDDAYLIVLVEEKLDNMLDYQNLCHFHYKTTIAPEHLFHNVRTLIQKYPCVQFLFINSHEEAGKVIERLFSIGEEIKDYDLQLLRDLGII